MKRSETRSAVSHWFGTLTFLLLFASNFVRPTKAKLIERILTLFRFQKFVVSLRFLRFASKRDEINVFLLCFASKRNEINVFSLLFTILGIDLKTYNASLHIFLRFFKNCPRISLYPFSFLRFRFFFVLFLFNFIFVLLQMRKQTKKLFSHRSEKNFATV